MRSNISCTFFLSLIGLHALAGCDVSDHKSPTKMNTVYLFSIDGDLVAEQLVQTWEPTPQKLDYCKSTMENIDPSSLV